MKTKRTLSLLLLAAMLAAVGCGDAKPSGDTTTASNDTTADTEPVETKVTDDLPADLDFTGRELRVLTTENTTYANSCSCGATHATMRAGLSPPERTHMTSYH